MTQEDLKFKIREFLNRHNGIPFTNFDEVLASFLFRELTGNQYVAGVEVPLQWLQEHGSGDIKQDLARRILSDMSEQDFNRVFKFQKTQAQDEYIPAIRFSLELTVFGINKQTDD